MLGLVARFDKVLVERGLGEEEWKERTKRGFMRRGMSVSHCLHFVAVVLAKTGTPQL